MKTMLYETLFELLKGGIREDYIPRVEQPVSEDDWRDLFLLSRQQTVAALAWDGVMKLPVGNLPPKKLRLEWLAFVVQVEKTNEIVNQRLTELFGIYRKNGLTPILLKGQGLATNYPNPRHRQCGDIDIYVGSGERVRADDLAKNLGADKFVVSKKHSHFTYHGVDVENHHQMATVHNPSRLRRFNRSISDWYPHRAAIVTIDDYEIAVPPKDFNAGFIFLHFYQHFIGGGIGLRQLCDWVILLDKNDISPDVDTLGYDKAWQAFGYIAVNCLGLPKEKMPFYTDKYAKDTAKILELIFNEGNFGRSDTDRFTKRPKGYYSGKLFTFFHALKRLGRLSSVFPKDTFDYVFRCWIALAAQTIFRERFNAKLD